MVMNRLRVLLVGYGSIGRRHTKNIRSIKPAVTLTLLRREKSDVANNRDADADAVVTTIEDAIRSKPDAAIIATPTGRHIDSLLPLLEAGIPCYIEKPVVSSREDVTQLRKYLDQITRPPITLVGCNYRFLPSLNKLKSVIIEGKLGRVVRASLQVGQWLPDWRPGADYRNSYSAHSDQGGGVILDLIHEIDMARWLFGEFEQVYALAGKLSTLDINAEDTACLLLKGEGGSPYVTVSLDYVSRRRIRRYEVVGEEGTAVWDLDRQKLEIVYRDESTVIDCGQDGFDIGKTYQTAVSHFLDCIQRDETTLHDLNEGLHSNELALEARRCAGL